MAFPKFFDAQRTTIEFGKTHKYAIYALDQGLGKSLVSIATAIETNSKALFVVPSYLMLKMESEINKFYPGKSISLLKNDREFYKLWDTDFAIISYYFLDKADVLFEWADMVIFDECQYLKNTKAKRTEAAHRLIYENSIKRCLFLSGTPIENRVYEFYSLIAMCNYDPEIEESQFLTEFPSYVDFANHFSYLKEFDMWRGNRKVKVQSWEGYKNVDELKNYLKPHYIRFKIDDVLELPASIDIEVPVSYEDNPELLKAFDQFGGSGDLSGVSSDVKSKAAISKAPFTAEYVKDLLDQCLQVVVYSDHPAAAEIIANKLGLKHIDGSTPMHVRQQMADNFQAKRTKAIVATAGSFSTGIDLFSAQDMVINDLPWKPSAEDQMRSRTRRNGQTGKCRYHYIYGTIQDKKIREKLEEKRKTIQAVV